MTTFDGWETQFYGSCLEDGQDSLAHFRTKGSKNGVRRYQQTDGTWTPLGLRERRIREGWGDRDQRRAEKKAAKAERKAAKAERQNAKTAAKQAAQEERDRRAFEAKEARRKKNIKNLTDDEMKALLNRAKMEQEYKEMTRSPLLQTGVKVVELVLNYKTKKEERAIKFNDQKIERMRIASENYRAKEKTKQSENERLKSINDAKIAKQEAIKADYDMQAKKADVKGGLKLARKKELINAKTTRRQSTLWGVLGQRAANRAKYDQASRMEPINVSDHKRKVEMARIALEKDKEATKRSIFGKGDSAPSGDGGSSDSTSKKKKKKS